LSSGIDAVLSVLDKSWHLARSGTLENLFDLRNSLLKNVRRADINLGDNDHDWHVKRQSKTEMLLAHSNKTVIGRNHE
jgi:hypothetical protein